MSLFNEMNYSGIITILLGKFWSHILHTTLVKKCIWTCTMFFDALWSIKMTSFRITRWFMMNRKSKRIANILKQKRNPAFNHLYTVFFFLFLIHTFYQLINTFLNMIYKQKRIAEDLWIFSIYIYRSNL